jgi:hypothetical protein
VTGYGRSDYGSAAIGGFAGRIRGTGVIVRDCYARGALIKEDGLVQGAGFAYNVWSYATVDNCYSTGFLGEEIGDREDCIGHLGGVCTDSF